MRLHALILALFVLAARAATIPEKPEVDFEKKLSEAVKQVIRKDENAPENIPCEQDLIDETNVVKDAENNLRNQVVDIPVKVVVDDKFAVKSDTDKKEVNEVALESEENIEREQIDVNNPPGPLQRQVHDTQNPEHFEDAKAKQAIPNQNPGPLISAQQNFNAWVSNNPQIQYLQQSVKEFQENFNKQIGSLANIVRGVLQGNFSPLQPQGAYAPAAAPVAAPAPTTSEVIQKDDKKSSGIRSVLVPKEENGISSDSSSGSNPSQGSDNDKPWWEQIQISITNMQTQLTNLSQQFQQFNSQQQEQQTNQEGLGGGFFQNLGSGLQFFNIQNQNNASQSDESQKPGGIWQNIQNLFQGGQQPPQNAQSDAQQPPAQPTRPIIQAVQSAIGSFWRPGQSSGGQSEAQKPASPEKPNQEGSNSVPQKPAEQQKEPETATLAQSGPIKQLIAHNPIAQGLAGAVQKVQHTIKPDQPRETIPEKKDQGVKGGLFFKPGHGHKPGHGDNTDKGMCFGIVVISIISTYFVTITYLGLL